MTDKYATKIVAASLLADGSVGIPPDGSKNAKYRQPKTVDHMDYVDWLASVLERVTPTNRYEWQPKMENAKRQVMLQTRCHPFYTRFRERMYPNGFKVVDPHYLTLLDWEFMAVWYQEDGSLSRDVRVGGNTYAKIVLCTQAFSYGDNHFLRKVIKERLDVDFNVDSCRQNGNQHYVLRLRSVDLAKFMDGVEPFILPSYKYKLCRTAGSTSVIVDEDIVRPSEESEEHVVNDSAQGEILE